MQPTTELEVEKVIAHLKNKKSVGIDQIPTSILKENANIISKPIGHIINLMFLTGTYPEQLKIAQIRAVHKKESKSDEKNYRPISILSNINKVIEKIIYERFITFIENNSLLSDLQNGFRRNKSTIRAIYQSLSKVLTSLNNNKVTMALLLDLSKAFDSVNHKKLCNKLENFGIRGIARQLVESYLENRIQCVFDVDKCCI